MVDPYEHYAAIFEASLAGKRTGLTKDQFIALCKSKFPDEAAFVKHMESLTALAKAQIEQAEAQLKPDQTLAIAIRLLCRVDSGLDTSERFRDA